MMRLPVFFAAPHRVMFLSGAVQALAAFALWAWRYAPACWRPRAAGKPG